MSETNDDSGWLERQVDDHPLPVFFAVLSGAHMYGFPSADSDFDVRGAHLVPLDELLGLETGHQTVDQMYGLGGREVDVVTHDLAKFMRLLLDKNAMVLEQVFSPHLIAADDAFEELRDIAKDCVTRHHAHHYLGFVRSRREAFEETQRLKPLLYAYRGCLSGIHLMRTGRVESNLSRLADEYEHAEIHDLVEAKQAGTEKMELPENLAADHADRLDALVEELERAHEDSDLPEGYPPAARARFNDLLVRVRLRSWG
ncbi:MAG: DNA polymerase beta superfamily protein [Persicimonas sp.]